MRYLYALAALLVATLVAVPAPVCQTHAPAAPGYHQKAVVVKEVVAAFPLYGAGYVGTTGVGDDETKELLRQLIESNRAILEAVKALGGGGEPPVPPLGAPKGPDVFEVVKAKCAGCHAGEKAGGGFEMANEKGELLRLSGPDRRSVLARIEGKGGAKMPPANKPQLTPAEVAALKAALSDAPKK
jgi:mono/diheme cytochrome c family protein